MKPKVINKCEKKHKINFENIVTEIIVKIPEKYLNGLSEVVFIDSQRKDQFGIKYVFDKHNDLAPRIEIDMDNREYDGYRLYSIFALNMDFVTIINEHIYKHLRPNSKDSDILSVDKNRINYNWMYWGKWNFLISFFIFVTHPIRKFRSVRNMLIRLYDLVKGQSNKKSETE